MSDRIAYAQDTALKEAEVAYTKEDYAKAIELYEGILKSNGESAAVYYNLGNAYYKAGKIAPAILNYERCLLLDRVIAMLASIYRWPVRRRSIRLSRLVIFLGQMV